MADKNSIKVEFSKASDYKLLPVTGAWGGVSPNKEVVVDLTVDYNNLPQSLELLLDDSGKQIGEKRDIEVKIIRESQVGLVLRPDIALSIGNWLVQKAKEAGAPEVEKG